MDSFAGHDETIALNYKKAEIFMTPEGYSLYDFVQKLFFVRRRIL
jgi:hypothetical protein